MAALPAAPAEPPAMEDGGAGLAARAEPSRLEGGGGERIAGGGEDAAAPVVGPLQESTRINAPGRLWTPGHATGEGTPC